MHTDLQDVFPKEAFHILTMPMQNSIPLKKAHNISNSHKEYLAQLELSAQLCLCHPFLFGVRPSVVNIDDGLYFEGHGIKGQGHVGLTLISCITVCLGNTS